MQICKYKWHSQVSYLGCVLGNTMSGETINLKAANKKNDELKLLRRKIRFITLETARMLWNVVIQSQFDYACPACYSNLTQAKQIYEKEMDKLMSGIRKKCIILLTRSLD